MPNRLRMHAPFNYLGGKHLSSKPNAVVFCTNRHWTSLIVDIIFASVFTCHLGQMYSCLSSVVEAVKYVGIIFAIECSSLFERKRCGLYLANTKKPTSWLCWLTNQPSVVCCGESIKRPRLWKISSIYHMAAFVVSCEQI